MTMRKVIAVAAGYSERNLKIAVLFRRSSVGNIELAVVFCLLDQKKISAR